MADNNRTYTTWMQTKVGDKTVVYLEGYVREDREGNTVTIKEVNGKDGPVNVATVLVSVTIGDRRAENLLGYVNKEYGSYFVRISMFGSVCDRIQKYAPAKNQRLGFLGILSINEYEGRNGVMKSLNLTANDFKVCGTDVDVIIKVKTSWPVNSKELTAVIERLKNTVSKDDWDTDSLISAACEEFFGSKGIHYDYLDIIDIEF